MRGPKSDPFSLSNIECNELQRMVRGHKTAQQVVLAEGGIGWEHLAVLRIEHENASHHEGQKAAIDLTGI